MRGKSLATCAIVATFCVGLSPRAMASITLTSDPNELAQALEHVTNPAGSLLGASFVALPPQGTPHGIGTSALGGFPTSGNAFVILTTGNAALANQPNNSPSSGVGLGGGSVRGNTDRDVSILRIDLNVPPGANCLSIDFRFFSEEYPEYVGSGYNDAFIAELNSSTWTTNGSQISAPNNFAFDPSGAPITINAVGATGMSAADASGTTYDGATPILTASTPIAPGANSLFLSIFDQGDNAYDSAVFLDRMVLGTAGSGGCQPGATVLSVAKTTSTALVFPSGLVAYEIVINNPSASPVSLTSITDSLPSEFAYVEGTTTGATSVDPILVGGDLVWQGPFALPANGSVSLSFAARASSVLGQHWNNASATAVGASVTPSGPTAPVTIIEPPCAVEVLPPIVCTEEQPCDVLGGGSICPPGASVTEDTLAIEMDGIEHCPGSTVRVIRSRTGRFTTTAEVEGTVCGSPCFSNCYESCVGIPLQQCYQTCLRRCVNGVCMEWETRCELSELQSQCADQCFGECADNVDPAGTSYFSQACGFAVADSVEIRVADGACGGGLVSVHEVSGAGTAVRNLPLPLGPGEYDVCVGGELLATTSVRDDCGVPACSLSAATQQLTLARGADGTLAVELSNLLAGGTYGLELRRYEDDAHSIELSVPTFLSLAETIFVAENAIETVALSAIDAQPEGGIRQWTNVMLIADGPVRCFIGIDVAVPCDPATETCDDPGCDDCGVPGCPPCDITPTPTPPPASVTPVTPMSTPTWMGTQTPVPACGNGVVEPGEQCDPGHTGAGTCCTDTCQFAPAEASCDADNEACTYDLCDGAGTCLAGIIAQDGTSCDDGNACTEQDVCTDGVCGGVAVDCDDGIACTVDSCHPVTGCRSIATVESRDCPGSCFDGINNDPLDPNDPLYDANDPNSDDAIDFEDSGCATLAPLARFAVIATRDQMPRDLKLGSNTTVGRSRANGTCNLSSNQCSCPKVTCEPAVACTGDADCSLGACNVATNRCECVSDCPLAGHACESDAACVVEADGTCDADTDLCKCADDAPNCGVRDRPCQSDAGCRAAPFPSAASAGGVCGYGMQITAGAHMGLLVSASKNQKVMFGTAESGSGLRTLDIEREFAGAGGPRQVSNPAPFLGPNVCSNNPALACRADADCPAGTCSGRRRLGDGSPFESSDGVPGAGLAGGGSSVNFKHCDAALGLLRSGGPSQPSALQAALLAYVPTPSQRVVLGASNCLVCPRSAAADSACSPCGSDVSSLQTRASAQKFIVTVGGGLQIIDLRRLTLAGKTTVVLRGQADTELLIRVDRALRSGAGARLQIEGMTADQVLFVAGGRMGGRPRVSGGSAWRGSILATERRAGIMLGARSYVEGGIYAQRILVKGPSSTVQHRPWRGKLP